MAKRESVHVRPHLEFIEDLLMTGRDEDLERILADKELKVVVAEKNIRSSVRSAKKQATSAKRKN